jgi:hypothetical protein
MEAIATAGDEFVDLAADQDERLLAKPGIGDVSVAIRFLCAESAAVGAYLDEP